MECQTAAAEQPRNLLARASKPVGGFKFVSVVQLLMPLWAHQSGHLQWRDVRVWFACLELTARRQGARSEVPAKYTADEVHRLVGGVGGEHIRASIRRLEAVGILSFSESDISFAQSPDEMRPDDLSTYWKMLDLAGQSNRKVPVPRRTIRFIAGGARRMVVATMVGHLIRCLYYRKGECLAEGSCKASWIADLFDVDLRHVKRARKHLAQIGWLTVVESQHWRKQRWGGRAAINLNWSRPIPEKDVAARPNLESKQPPQNELFTTVSPPPIENKKLFLSEDLKYQKPAVAADRPSGVSIETKVLKKPTMRHVEPEDLRNTTRTLGLFEDACRQGLVSESESDRLKFIAAADRAVTIGTRNPPGLFARIVRGKLWHHLSQDDEDAAAKRLKQHFFGNSRPKAEYMGFSKPMSVRAELSMDAKIVLAVKRVVTQHRLSCDPFHLIIRERPEWTRERWERAHQEYERSRACPAPSCVQSPCNLLGLGL